MKTFRCTNCDFEIDKRKLPEDYICPECNAPREAFVEEEKLKAPFFLLFLYCITITVLIISGAFTFSVMFNQNKIPSNNVKVGNLSIELVERTDTTIRLIDSFPMSDEKASKLSPFLFKINNTGTYSLDYRLKLVDVSENELTEYKEEISGKDRINNKYIKYSITDVETNKIVETGLVNEIKDTIILQGKIEAADVKSYAFRVWIDKDATNDAQNKFYAGRLILEVNDITE